MARLWYNSSVNRKDVIAKTKSLNLPRGSYIVYGSAPFAVLGIREVNDIDLLVSDELYEKLKKDGWKKVIKGPNDEPLTFDIYDAHRTWKFSGYAPSLPELLSRSFEVEGVPFASLEDVQKWKADWGREKDLEDIILIDNYLKSSN